MRVKAFFIAAVVAFAAACASNGEHGASGNQKAAPAAGAKSGETAGAARDAHGHAAEATADVPAFVTSAAELKRLPATLSPEQFSGMQRLGYQAAREIPQTLAQLPCYCHCDRGFGHKSLHSCFVDTHAAHCAVCIDEALTAYKLEKEDRLTPEQIRQRIIALYSNQ